MHLKNWENIQLLNMQCGQYEKLFKDSTLLQPDEYIFLYESLAKDGWNKGEVAKPDLRTFYHRVTEEDRQALLDKFADVVTAVEDKKLPPKEEDKCMFCQYKHLCIKEVE